MWRNHSLIYPVIISLLLVISATLAVGYTINFAILEDVLRERMEREARQVGSDILRTLEQKVHRLERFKESWLENASWTQEAGRDPRLSGQRVEETPESLWGKMQEFFPLWGVDFILLLDASGQVARQMPADFLTGQQPLQPAMTTRMQNQISQNQAAWHLERVAGQWQIMFFVPLRLDGQEKSYLMVFGQDFSKIVQRLLQENPQRPFLVADVNGVAAGSRELLAGIALRTDVAAASIRENSPRMLFDSSLASNLYYTPIAFLDQTFSLVVPVSLDEVRQVLANSRQRLSVSFLFIVLFLMGLGVVMERVLLRPLRQLRGKACTMVSACSRQEQALYLSPNEHGNEIMMLEKAMEEASIKLYAHVAHLVDTKHLLEGFALKDPITALGNRRMLDEFLALTLGSCKRKKRQVAVILIVPDLAKYANDLAPDAGNQLLRELADRLRKQMRGEDLAFRVQENEFVAFAPECGDEEQILSMVYRLHHALTLPYRLVGDRELTLDVHLGVSVFPGAGEEGEQLLANARIALERAQKAGRRPFSIFNDPGATEENDPAGEG
ncbi:MAG: GGDEF domain-containing protein [Magnetococcus sp. XQGC-1]